MWCDVTLIVVGVHTRFCYCCCGWLVHWTFFFFFQAEDGIRDWSVTGVQTCALPISVNGVGPKVALAVVSGSSPAELRRAIAREDAARFQAIPGIGKKTAERIVLELKSVVVADVTALRSEERRVGKECRSRWAA